MLKRGPALKVTVHLNQDADSPGGFLQDAVLDLLQKENIAGASVIHPYAGFGVHGRLHTQGAGSVAGEHLPVMIQFVDEEAHVQQLLPKLLDLVTDGMVEVHPTEILKIVSGKSRVIS